ncbi:conserved hypothetical protein [Histoplasma mississippiense (nom. inval.)]|uniref:conserved hypothetical protein n=2 Tax=Ajellomyces capsulatus (strain NAm1 / WU24) TaxID=2059318 RepID=UPI000157C64F|nr:conserved hypothetical protein [Histoplasma mississippiense (nom. inval.)]EDN08103.1 conserved hypothetical protein [Histoplasma mississippiense (nom. inval.)]
MSTTSDRRNFYQEGRILLAIKALDKGQISGIRAAARAYEVPYSSLYDRLHGRTTRKDSQLKNRKLSLTEEASLIQWILSMTERGQSPRITTVRNMANLLLSEREIKSESKPPPTVGECWVRNFVNRHEELKSTFSRKYDHQRALCENPEIIRGWFNLVRNTIAKYGIAQEDTYNFDETGFQMGVIGTARVITGSERVDRPNLIQPGDREWATVIAGVNATGWALRTMIILKGKMHQSHWYETEKLPHDWVIGVSENGWTNDKLGLIWLKEIFDKDTRSRTKGKYRLLILDGHGSHASAEFDQFCSENDIIALYMPSHSSHLLQPLDVSCFSPLKKAYRRQVEKQMQLGINHIDKEEFLTLYPAAHMEALNENNIKSGFKATGLVPYDPEQVLSRLNTQMHTPTPPGTSHSSQASWATATPHNVRQVDLQAKKIKGYMQHRTQGSSSPTNRAMNQLIKGCQMAMCSAAILAKENKELRAANEKQKRKRGKGRTYIAQEGVLRVEEGIDRVRSVNEQENEKVEVSDSQPRKRAAPRCSICGTIGHTALINMKKSEEVIGKGI